MAKPQRSYPRNVVWGDVGITSLGDFSGLLNIRDAPMQLGPSESPDVWNVVGNERGGVECRLGYTKYNSGANTPYQAALVNYLYHWPTGGNKLVQCGAKLYKDTSTTAFKTFTSTARCAMADFLGKVYIIHPIDGMFTYDGTTVTAVAAGPKGTTLCVWQNILWAAGDPTAGSASRVWSSAIGDGATWPATNYVDIREKDNQPIICLAGASGVDTVGRSGFLVFKSESTYRINNSVTGAYATIDAKVGAASAISVVNIPGGKTITLSTRGIFETNGTSDMKPLGEREEPLWDASQINYAHPELFCAGLKANTVCFSLPQTTATANNLAIEYHPDIGWISVGSNAASCYASHGGHTYFGSPSVNGQVYLADSGGTDDGTPITSWFQTRWVEPALGDMVRMRRVKIAGDGAVDLYAKKDYTSASGIYVGALDTITSYFVWGTTVWGDPVHTWGPYDTTGTADLPLDDCVYAVAFRVQAVSTTTRSRLIPFVDGSTITRGAWALYGLDLNFIPLGPN